MEIDMQWMVYTQLFNATFPTLFFYSAILLYIVLHF